MSTCQVITPDPLKIMGDTVETTALHLINLAADPDHMAIQLCKMCCTNCGSKRTRRQLETSNSAEASHDSILAHHTRS